MIQKLKMSIKIVSELQITCDLIIFMNEGGYCFAFVRVADIWANRTCFQFNGITTTHSSYSVNQWIKLSINAISLSVTQAFTANLKQYVSQLETLNTYRSLACLRSFWMHIIPPTNVFSFAPVSTQNQQGYLGLTSLRQSGIRVTFKLCVTVYKCVHGLAQQYLSELCVPVADVAGGRQLRSARRGLLYLKLSDFFLLHSDARSRGHPYKLFLPGCSSTARHNYYTHRVARAWNNLPDNSTNFSSLALFKRSLRSSILARYCKIYYF